MVILQSAGGMAPAGLLKGSSFLFKAFLRSMEVGLERSRLGIKCTCRCADSSPLKLGSGGCLTNSGNIKAECSPPTATALQLPLQGDMKQRRNLQLEQNQHTRR